MPNLVNAELSGEEPVDVWLPPQADIATVTRLAEMDLPVPSLDVAQWRVLRESDRLPKRLAVARCPDHMPLTEIREWKGRLETRGG